MASVFFKEIRRPGKDWERVTLGKDRHDADEAVKTSRRCNSDDEHRVAEYVRVVDSWLDVEIQNGAGTWVAVGCACSDEAELLASMEAERHLYLSAYRVVRVVRGEARHVVKTFEPKGGV